MAQGLQHCDHHPVKLVSTFDSLGERSCKLRRHQEHGPVLPAAEPAVSPYEGLECRDVQGALVNCAVDIQVRRLTHEDRAA